MSKTTKYIMTLCIHLLVPTILSAQDLLTEYYVWTKTYYTNGSTKSLDGTLGQFVTRTQKVCYDSYNTGETIGNGVLKLINRQGNASKYLGSCYYGAESTYTFYDNKGILNIQDVQGNVYVYKKATPPQGKTKSSLIVGQNHGIYSAPSTNKPSVSQQNGNKKSNSKQPIPKRCSKCSGRGFCTTCSGKGFYRPNISSKNEIKCSVCRGSGRCSLCNGTGTFGHY